MRYSLTSRVRGTLLGSLLGQSLITTQAEESYYYWNKAAIQGIKSLIEEGEFDFNKWDIFQPSTWDSKVPCDSIEANLILATLPIALYFHDNHIKLRENLLLAIKHYKHLSVEDGVLAVCYLVAESLNENIDRKISQNTLIPEITSFIGETKSGLPILLNKVNSLMAENIGLTELQNYIGKENNINNIIAIAFYCFANTKEDFRLTCLRATATDNLSPFCSAIAGAISGAYNSMAGIPLTWHLGLDEAKLAQWGLTSFSQMVKLADALVAVWSGAYELLPQLSLSLWKEVKNTDLICANQAIAAPYIIRLR